MTAYIPLFIYILYMTGSCVSLHVGHEFLTAFLQNSNLFLVKAQFQLMITAFTDHTSVTVSLNDRNHSWSLRLNDRDSHVVKLPVDVEMIGIGIFDSSILISSNYDISVLAMSSKTDSTARILVLPVDQLDSRYYIITPDEENVQSVKEFAVINYDLPSKIQIYPKSWAIMNGVNYTATNPFTVDLKPYQVFQFQSSRALSGTRVLSNNIVALLSGGICSWKDNHCSHIYEQLFPVSGWGKEYYVTPFPFQHRTDIVYVMTSQDTKIKYTSSIKNGSIVLHEGQVSNFPIKYYTPLILSANVSIQVLFYCTGGLAGKIPFHPFFINVPDISKFCFKYQVYGLQGFNNVLMITAKTSSISGIKFNRIRLSGIKWKSIPGSEYSWAQYRYGRQFKSHVISHPTSMFSVLNVGISSRNSYGLSGACFKSTDTCANKQCRKKESCRMIKRKPACIPDSEAFCQISGDSHYKTFDGFSYDFQGTCTYILAKTCMDLRAGGDSTLPEFSIEAKRFNRGAHQSSYIATVSVRIHEYLITMAQSEVGFVRVNNVRWSLPIFLDGGRIQITTSGFHALLETSFTRIRYDWKVFLIIEIPSSFFENVCGLCGNYNGIKDDDLETVKGIQISDMIKFGKSWKVKDEYSTCSDNCKGPCIPVIPERDLQYIYSKECGIISLKNGPFQKCHQIIPPDIFQKDCISDMVKNGGYKKILCDAVSVYLVACQVQGIPVGEWRKKVGCEIECPENSHYSPCGTSCPETCAGQLSSCRLPCMETCKCNVDFVLHEGVCIPKTDCGHFCDGRYYPTGKIFWGDNGCKQRCTCDPNSKKIKCRKAECQDGEECAVKNGIKDCYPLNYGQCIAFGDPHYITFDKMWYTFHSTCSFSFSELCDKSLGLTEYYIEISNKKRGVHDVSFITSVLVRVYDFEILFNRMNPGKAMVNGVLHRLPINLHLDKIQVFVKWREGVILTDFGMEVTFDWDSRVTVALPDSYAGAVCGLCGNFNGNIEDELMLENGELTKDVRTFEKSWRKMDQTEECRELVPAPCGLLQLLDKIQRILLSDCGIILRDYGPFHDCHRLMNPEPYFQKCIHDFCYDLARQGVFCKVIEAYAAACHEMNGTIQEWRGNNFCRAWCPKNSYYTVCSYAYQKTCNHFTVPSKGINHCREACVCEDGYFFEGDQCVRASDCGCRHGGIYYKVNEIFYPTPNCDKKCLCQYGGLVKCSPYACGLYEVCRIKDGVKKCHPTEEAMCSVLGGSHYYTFDGGKYQFPGKCTNVLTKACLQNSCQRPSFLVVMSTAIPKKVGVFLNDIRIIMTEDTNRTIQVNDVSFNLPLTLQDSGVSVWQHGVNLLLTTNFGLEVIYDLGFQTIIRITSSFYGQLCGLCGNYNGDNADDSPHPDGNLGIDNFEFDDAWKDRSLEKTCKNHCSVDVCPTCKESRLYKGKNFCGLLIAKGGLFSACHDHVDPVGYFDNCVFDLCRKHGDSRVLCNSLQSYVTMCNNVGITKIKWRSERFCRLDCPDHSHYEICSDTCNTTCSRIDATETCSGSCSEGCQCDDGYYLDIDKCVQYGRCGCLVEGKYYTLNDNFLGDNCLQLCTCQLGGAVACKAHQCPPDTTCKRVLDRTYICAK